VIGAPRVRSGFSECPERRRRAAPRGAQSDSLPIAVLAKTLAPRIGIVTSTALYFSPLSAVVKAVAASDMGTLNPLPLALMSISTIRLEVHGKLTLGPLSLHKRALMGGVGALVNSFG